MAVTRLVDLRNKHMENNIVIKSSQGEYHVNAIASLAAVIHAIALNKNKKIAVVDKNLYKYYPDFLDQLSQIMPVLAFNACEQNKNIQGLEKILQFMQENKLDKKSELIVIGGGIIQDVSALASHLYYRGIKYTLIPSTLLGMADSCIGSKSSLNFQGYKNQLGSFYPPSQVYICSQFLKSLSKLDFYSGYGEIFKLFIINNSLEDFHFNDVSAQNDENQNYLLQAIFKALQIKKEFIEQDEFDSGIRKILNYGHTFGHAIESVSNYEMPHGLAVVLGMDIANYLAMRFNILSKELFLDIHTKIHHFLDWSVFNLNINPLELLECVKQDKKNQQDKVNMIFLTTQEKMILESLDMSENDLLNYLMDYFRTYYLEFNIGSGNEQIRRENDWALA
jgi:3-dehydroquinate synthase